MLCNRCLIFGLWIVASVFIHFCLTCALIHPLDKSSPPDISFVQDIASVEAHLVSMPQSKQTPPQEEEIQIVNSKTSSTQEILPETPAKKKSSTQLEAKEPLEIKEQLAKKNAKELIADASPDAEGTTQWQAPSILKNPTPRYPSKSRAAGHEGIASLWVKIDRTGCPCEVKLISSSGYAELDQRALETVRTRWRFSAPDPKKKVADTLEFSIAFELKQRA